MSVSGQIQPNLSFSQLVTSGFLNGQSLAIGLNTLAKFVAGTAADSIDGLYAHTFTFVASTMQTMDVSTLTDIFGVSITAARARFIAIRVNGVVDGSSLTITPDATNGWAAFTTSLKLLPSSSANPAGGFFILTAPNTTGYPIDGTHKVLDMTPSAHAFTVDVVIGTASV